MNPSLDFDALNLTELYQICRHANIPVLPSTPREKMIAYLLGDEEPEEVSHPIDDWRIAIMRFVLAYQKKLETQLDCPAKSMDPRACFQCPDTKAVACLVENKACERDIRSRKPNPT